MHFNKSSLGLAATMACCEWLQIAVTACTGKHQETKCDKLLFLPHRPLPPMLPEMAPSVFTSKLTMRPGNNIFFFQRRGKKKEPRLWIFIKMTHLFSNFSKVIPLKVLSANFNYSLRWSEHRIHHVELAHSTTLLSVSLLNGKERWLEERRQSANWIIMICRYLIIINPITITTAFIFQILYLRFAVRKTLSNRPSKKKKWEQSHYASSGLTLQCQ